TAPRAASSMSSAESVSLPHVIQATGSWLLPRQVCLLLNMSAFTGRTKALDPYTPIHQSSTAPLFASPRLCPLQQLALFFQLGCQDLQQRQHNYLAQHCRSQNIP